MPAVLGRKALRDARGALIGGGIAVFVIVMLHAAIYQSVSESPGNPHPDALEGIYGEAGDSTSPEGYTGAYLSNLAVLLAVIAIVVGTGATAGEEGAGTLDLLLSHPVTRRKVVLGKAAGLAVGLSLAALAGIPAFLLGGMAADQQLTGLRFGEAALSEIPFVLLFLAIGLWSGAALPTRALAGTVSAAVMVVAYVLTAVGGIVDLLDVPRKLSPFYGLDSSHVLLHGFDWWRSGGMLAATGIVLALALRSFERREIAAGPRTMRMRLRRRAGGSIRERGAAAARSPGHGFAGPAGLVRKTLRDVRGPAIGAGLAAFALVLVDVLLYPSYADTLKDFEYPEALQGMLGEAGSIASPEGFMVVEFFTLISLTLVTVAIIAGTAATAGEEGAGTLDLLLAQPRGRGLRCMEKWAGSGLALVAATMIAVPGFLIGQAAAGMDLAASRFIAALVNVLSVEFLFLALALWAGTVFPGRASAATFTTSIMVACYLLPTLAAVSDFFETARILSPFYWADASRALIHGFDPLRGGASFAVSAAFLALAFRAIQRRDIAMHSREWQWRVLFRCVAGPRGRLTGARR